MVRGRRTRRRCGYVGQPDTGKLWDVDELGGTRVTRRRAERGLDSPLHTCWDLLRRPLVRNQKSESFTGKRPCCWPSFDQNAGSSTECYPTAMASIMIKSALWSSSQERVLRRRGTRQTRDLPSFGGGYLISTFPAGNRPANDLPGTENNDRVSGEDRGRCLE